MKQSPIRIALGIILTLLGGGLLLRAFGFEGLDEVFASYWPIGVIILGLAMLLTDRKRPLFPVVVVLFGLLLQLRVLDIVELNVFELFWPLVIIAVGVSLLANKTVFSWKDISKNSADDLTAFLSGINTKNVSHEYKGGKTNAILGGIELDLREAHMKDGASIDAFALMGGIDIRVPKEWNVRLSGMPIMGGWEDKTTKPSSEKAPILTINATCVMGGIQINN